MQGAGCRVQDIGLVVRSIMVHRVEEVVGELVVVEFLGAVIVGQAQNLERRWRRVRHGLGGGGRGPLRILSSGGHLLELGGGETGWGSGGATSGKAEWGCSGGGSGGRHPGYGTSLWLRAAK